MEKTVTTKEGPVPDMTEVEVVDREVGAAMPRFHRQVVDYDDSEAYRYLLCCRRCVNWRDANRNRGTCAITGNRKWGQTLSCKDFQATADGDLEIWMETFRIRGELVKVMIGDQVFYADLDEVKEILRYLGELSVNLRNLKRALNV